LKDEHKENVSVTQDKLDRCLGNLKDEKKSGKKDASDD
jgi:hypothetical protein